MAINRKTRSRSCRRGTIVVLTAILLVFLLGLVALSVDVGAMLVARTQLQDSADAAALAAVAELVDSEALTGTPNMSDDITRARAKAVQYAAANKIGVIAPVVGSNTSNSSTGDVVVGYLSQPSNPATSMDLTHLDLANSVKVTVQRTAAQNGEVGLYFARIFGRSGQAMTASATAAIQTNISGFKAPSDGTNLNLLPFALDVDTWNNMLAGGGTDNYSWNEGTKSITNTSDGVREINLYPQGTGSPGNRGTVDIGSSNNSTADIARQIVSGISPSDLSYMPGGKVALDANGLLNLNGDTGISAGVKDELASIKGLPRVIPLFKSVSGPGNNATYVICAFVGIRIVDVKLTGSMSSKYVMIQPANVKIKGGIAGTGTQTSNYIYSPAWLVR